MAYKENDMVDEVFYDDEYKFKPLTDIHGNIDPELSHLRDTYMEAEREYFKRLLSDDGILENFMEVITMPNEYIFRRAEEIHNRLESDTLETPEEKERMQKMKPEEREKYHMMVLTRAEGLMCLFFAAAADKARINELVLECTKEKGGRGR